MKKVVFILLLLPSIVFGLKGGDVIKKFELRDYNGVMHYSTDLCGKDIKGQRVLIIIDFFATWCAPCKRSLEVFKKLHSKYGKRGLKIALISFQEKERAIREFAEANSVPFPILMDKYGEMAKDFGVYGLPRTFIIKGDCTLKRQIIGELQNLEEELEKEIREELGEKQ